VVIKSSIFWDTTLCSSLKFIRRFRRIRCLRLQGQRALLATRSMLVPYMVYSLTMKIEKTYTSETSVSFQRNTRHYISEKCSFRNIIPNFNQSRSSVWKYTKKTNNNWGEISTSKNSDYNHKIMRQRHTMFYKRFKSNWLFSKPSKEWNVNERQLGT
jgi:hypothetical protein